MGLTGQTFFFQWEVDLEAGLQRILGDGAINVVSFFSLFGEEIFLILVVGFLYWWYDKKTGKNVGLYVLIGESLNSMIKNIFLRRRPYMDHESIEIKRIVNPEGDPMNISAQGYSFPSGHSVGAVTAYGGMAKELKKKWVTVLGVVLPLLVGFSRVVVGAHYPTDVLCGWLIGLLSIVLVSFLRKKINNTLAFYGILLLITIPGLFYCRSEDYFSSIGLLIGFMGGTLLEEKKVNFENTRSVLFGILRLIGGLAIFLGLNSLLKLPFSKEFLGDGSTAALLVRMLRYLIISFVEFGVYPMAFAPCERWLSGFKKN